MSAPIRSLPRFRWLALLAVGSVLSVGGRALADVFWNPAASGTYGALTLAAATATQVPAAPMAAGRGQVFVQNRDAASIFCGFDSSVTASNGVEVLSNGTMSIPVSYNSQSGKVALWCFSTPGTAANAVRYMETL